MITSQNVVGRLVGKKRPDETVIYSGHWDHLGVGEPDAKGDRIYNGAVDNATGIASLLELGRAFAKAPRTDRSVVFLAVTAEEKGLLGSEYYGRSRCTRRQDGRRDQHGRARPARPVEELHDLGSAKVELLDQLTAKAKAWGLAYSADPHPEAGHFFRSDHFPFAKRGVPAISYGSGNDWVDGGVAAAEASDKAYTADRYHQPADQWEASWTFKGMARDLQMLYSLGRDLANSDRWPNWSQDSEFRAARDASAADRR